MATKFSEIFEKAIWKVRDFDSLIRTPESSENMYFHLLISAISDVQHYVPTPLTYKLVEAEEPPDNQDEEDEVEEIPEEPTARRRRRRTAPIDPEPPEDDDDDEEDPAAVVKEYIFDEELPADVQELLALGVAVKWMEPFFLNSDALKKGMYNKDYKDFGLDADKIAGIYHNLRKLFEGKAKTMSFRYSNFDRLSVGRR
jgi:hypothetical protein